MGLPLIEDYFRREQIIGNLDSRHSWMLRPFRLSVLKEGLTNEGVQGPYFFQIADPNKKIDFLILPIISQNTYNSKRPYGWGNKGMLPNVGFQSYLSTGFFVKLGFFEVQFQPELVYGQNKAFDGFGPDFSTPILQARFFYWNNGDNPERFGTTANTRAWWGQSSVKLNFGPLAIGLSTENIWWGPGYFNALIFSSNAEGFPHLSLNTTKPIKTPIGHFESQILVGRLENSQLSPTQNDFLNARYFKEFTGGWRYLNAIHINYSPVFIRGLSVGFSRTFQQYNQFKGNNFNDWFPIFEVFQKKTLFTNGNSMLYDNKGQDQQVAVSFRFVSQKGRFEVYSEFGRRDHAFDWRDFIMNPDHARAYLMGFQKLVPLPRKNQYIQIRGELTHQQESVNRYIRYPGLIGNQTWHTHGLARGFVNRGEALGVGSGVGSNVQTIEVSVIKGLNKKGILLERLENHQDFFYRAFGQNAEKKPWIDFSLGLVWNHQWQNLLISSKAQFIRSSNYQWQSASLSSQDFSNGQGKMAFFGQINLIYSFSKN